MYNADGARVKRAEGSATTYYIGNWYEVTNSNAVTKYYYFGGRRVALQHIAPQQGGVLTYLHTDHLGSTSVASNASGALVARQTYFPYGAPRTREGALPTTPPNEIRRLRLPQIGSSRWRAQPA